MISNKVKDLNQNGPNILTNKRPKKPLTVSKIGVLNSKRDILAYKRVKNEQYLLPDFEFTVPIYWNGKKVEG